MRSQHSGKVQLANKPAQFVDSLLKLDGSVAALQGLVLLYQADGEDMVSNQTRFGGTGSAGHQPGSIVKLLVALLPAPAYTQGRCNAPISASTTRKPDAEMVAGGKHRGWPLGDACLVGCYEMTRKRQPA
jgi:hypothetical protein